MIDEIRTVNYETADEFSQHFAREEGIFEGDSSGAALAVALDLAEELGSGKRILVMLPDTGERYLYTELFSQD